MLRQGGAVVVARVDAVGILVGGANKELGTVQAVYCMHSAVGVAAFSSGSWRQYDLAYCKSNKLGSLSLLTSRRVPLPEWFHHQVRNQLTRVLGVR